MNISDFLTDFKLHHSHIKLRAPHAVSVHIGWLNWGNVGDIALGELVAFLKAEKIAEFERPGDFYNFVSYRDRSRTYIDNKGNRCMEFPNSRVYYARRKEPLSDLVLLHLLEPTQFGEIYADRVVTLMKRLNVARYVVIGAMGSSAPHTRPIVITGRSSDPELTQKLKKIGMRETSAGQYQGPTSIFSAISTKLQSEGITTVSLIANLPSYFNVEGADYNGVSSILKLLSKLEEFEIPLNRFEALGKQQYDRISKEVHMSKELSAMVNELENKYDQEEAKEKEEEIKSQLPVSIQKAINEILDKN